MNTMRGDGIRRPLEDITTVDELREALLHLEGMALENAGESIERTLLNHAYFKGDYMHLVRSAPVSIQGKLGDLAHNARMHKDIVKPKVQNYTSLLSRAAPAAQTKSHRPDDMAEYMYDGNWYAAGEYDNRLVAQKMNEARKLEWEHRKNRVLQKRQVQESLIAGLAFTVMSIRQDPWRGPVVQPRLAYRHQVLLDPACKDVTNFTDARYIRVQTEMSAAEIYDAFDLTEKDYMGGDADKQYLDNTSMIRRFWAYSDDEDQMEVKRELPTYPVKAFFWNPGVPDLINFDGDIEEMERNPHKRDRRPRLFILVNDWAIPYGFEEDHRGPDLYGMYPIVCHCHDPLSDKADGSSLVSQLVGTQNFVDVCYNAIGKNVQLNSGTQWMAERGAVRGKNFSMRPNVLMFVEHDALSRNRIKQIEPGDVGSSVHNFMQSEIAYSRELAGDPQGLLSGIAPASVKSGIHAQTLLETANTLMAEYARMLDVGHLNFATIETLMMQQHTDFNNEFYVERLGLDEYPNIDLALADLKFEVTIETKSNLPSTSLTGELNWFMILYNMGLIPPAVFMKITEMSELMPEEWMAKMEAMTPHLIPGIPMAEQVMNMIQAMGLKNELDAELQRGGTSGINVLNQLTGAGTGEGAVEPVPALPQA